jgi:hypothetical protein
VPAPAPSTPSSVTPAKASKGLPILALAAGIAGVMLIAGVGLLALRRPQGPDAEASA